MAAHSFDDLRLHIGHELECVAYSAYGSTPVNVAVECMTCCEVLLDFDHSERGDGVSGQDRESYSDTQDREDYRPALNEEQVTGKD